MLKMDKLTISDLVELECGLHNRRIAEELPSVFSFRDSQPDNKVYNLDEAKAYLQRKGYSIYEISRALDKFNQNDLNPRFIDVYEVPVVSLSK